MKKIILNGETAFEFEIARGLKELIVDSDSFYHINVTENEIAVGRQGYNTPDVETISFDMSDLQSDDIQDQKKDAIESAYVYTFSKTKDLEKRVSDVENNVRESDTHAFYHDRTGKYPEELIVSAVKFHHPETFEKGKGIGR